MRRVLRRLRTKLRSPRPSGPSLPFGLVGAAGWIARVHLEALRREGHQVVLAMDPSDAGIAILDNFFPEAVFLRNEIQLEEMLNSEAGKIRYLSICSPDHCHVPQIELALRNGVDAICEKPLVMQPEQLDRLEEAERRTGRSVFPIMQQRDNPAILDLQRRLAKGGGGSRAEIEVAYVVYRGPWYLASWRGAPEHAAGLAMDIGIHFFDLLTWLYGDVKENIVHLRTPRTLGGLLELDRATVRWFLSIDHSDLPQEYAERKIRSVRSMRVDGREVELSRRMKTLHDVAYRRIVEGRGLRISDVRPGLELASAIQEAELTRDLRGAHPLTQARSARIDESG